MTSQMVGSDFTGATQTPNYVNGRLLTAEDLATSQATLRVRDGRLGQAAGHGVVKGLWVSFSATTLSVDAGLAIAPSGDAVTVGSLVTLPLTYRPPSSDWTAGASFSDCAPGQVGGSAAIAPGCYLLTALPVCQLSGQAPMANPPDHTMAVGCSAQWQVEGVQFKAIALPLQDSVKNISFTDVNRRTLIAHWCLGTDDLAFLGVNPFSFGSAYGGLTFIDQADLTPFDVPLAVFSWNGQKIDYVDNWSVRRCMTAPDPGGSPDPVSGSWSNVVSDRRRADGQARFLQFQDHIAELVASASTNPPVPDRTVAEALFPILPPLGFLPVVLQDPEPCLTALSEIGLTPADLEAVRAALNNMPTGLGFDLASFFGTAAKCGGILDWDIADGALRQSWETAPATSWQPADLSSPPFIWYLVLQNLMAGETYGSEIASGLYVMFMKNTTWVAGTQLPFTPWVPPSSPGPLNDR